MFPYIDINKLKLLFVYDRTDPLVFTSSMFLFSFFILLALYRLFYKSKSIRIYLLIVFSIYFYYKASGIYFLLLFLITFLNYYGGKWIGGTKTGRKRRAIFIVTIVANIGLLIYFKYTNFFVQIVNAVRSSQITPLDIFLPVGIS